MISLFFLSFLFLLFVSGIIASILMLVKFKTDDDFNFVFLIVIVFCLFGSLNTFRNVLEKAESIDAQVLKKTEK